MPGGRAGPVRAPGAARPSTEHAESPQASRVTGGLSSGGIARTADTSRPSPKPAIHDERGDDLRVSSFVASFCFVTYNVML